MFLETLKIIGALLGIAVAILTLIGQLIHLIIYLSESRLINIYAIRDHLGTIQIDVSNKTADIIEISNIDLIYDPTKFGRILRRIFSFSPTSRYLIVPCIWERNPPIQVRGGSTSKTFAHIDFNSNNTLLPPDMGLSELLIQLDVAGKVIKRKPKKISKNATILTQNTRVPS